MYAILVAQATAASNRRDDRRFALDSPSNRTTETNWSMDVVDNPLLLVIVAT